MVLDTIENIVFSATDTFNFSTYQVITHLSTLSDAPTYGYVVLKREFQEFENYAFFDSDSVGPLTVGIPATNFIAGERLIIEVYQVEEWLHDYLMEVRSELNDQIVSGLLLDRLKHSIAI